MPRTNLCPKNPVLRAKGILHTKNNILYLLNQNLQYFSRQFSSRRKEKITHGGRWNYRDDGARYFKSDRWRKKFKIVYHTVKIEPLTNMITARQMVYLKILLLLVIVIY